MPHAKNYDHVLFSKFVYLKKDFKWLTDRKREQQKKETKDGS